MGTTLRCRASSATFSTLPKEVGWPKRRASSDTFSLPLFRLEFRRMKKRRTLPGTGTQSPLSD
jgi:hypothetical protein